MAEGKPVRIKSVPNAVLFEGFVLKITGVRASYPHLDVPYKGDGDEGVAKYSIQALLAKDTHREAAKLLAEAIADFAAYEKFKVAKDKRCIKDGKDSGKDEQENCYVVSARESKAPTVRDKTGKKIEDRSKIPDLIYPGCYVDIIIRLWKQDNKFGKRVNANLVSVVFRDDGDELGEGRIKDDDYFDEDEWGSTGTDDDDGWGDDDEI